MNRNEASPLHRRARALETESAFRVLQRAQELESQGREIVHLQIGQPDFPTAPHICDAAVAALRDGQTGYGPTPGIPRLRQAIAQSAGELRGIEVDPDRVIVTPGGKPVIFYAIHSLAGSDDEVLYPDPGFPMYSSLTAHSGARGVPLPLREERDFRFDADEFRARVNDRTRLCILNSPQNPTGGVLSHEDLETIAEAAQRHDFYVLADEIYSRFLYEGRFESIAAIDGMAERTIILDGFSKTYAMTGWRLGYAIVPAALREAFEMYNVNIISCTATFNQYGAVAAIEGSQDGVDTMLQEFRRRRDFLVDALGTIPGFRCRRPGGAFYAFPNITQCGLSDQELASELLEQAGVAVLAGSSFGEAGSGFLRLSYANSLANIERGVERIREFVTTRLEPGK